MLEAVTARNVAANLQACQGDSSAPRARYFAGGWAELPALLQGLGLLGAYDVVLSAETLYSPGSHAALYQGILQARPSSFHSLRSTDCVARMPPCACAFCKCAMLDNQIVPCMQSLRPGTGVAYVAAKTYYFGVGGGTAAFRRLVDAGGVLAVRTVAVLDDGVSVKREILELAFA